METRHPESSRTNRSSGSVQNICLWDGSLFLQRRLNLAETRLYLGKCVTADETKGEIFMFDVTTDQQVTVKLWLES